MPRKKPDPLEVIIERALLPDQFISYQHGWEFVSGLERAKSQIDGLIASGEPERAVRLYECLIAGCYEKAEEIDDSDGRLGDFAESVFCAWISARQAAKADPGETARRIWEWMRKDDYGFCSKLEREAAQVFNAKGLKAFEHIVRTEHDAKIAAKKTENSGSGTPFVPRYTGEILKAIYRAQRNIAAYVELCGDTGLSPADCCAIAEIHEKGHRLAEALQWIERGIEMESRKPWAGMPSFGFAILRRRLLRQLGKEEEALESAWNEFVAAPSVFLYDEVFKYVPKHMRQEWRQRAFDAAGKARSSDFMAICARAKEWDRLSEFALSAADPQLEAISHFISEPAAKALARSHPAAAAKLFRALGMRILKARKSKYYTEALENLRNARVCYLKAGLAEQWDAAVSEIRRDHRRKHGFLHGFELLAAGKAENRRPSFLERARRRWN
jgi:hypothetical protein